MVNSGVKFGIDADDVASVMEKARRCSDNDNSIHIGIAESTTLARAMLIKREVSNSAVVQDEAKNHLLFVRDLVASKNIGNNLAPSCLLRGNGRKGDGVEFGYFLLIVSVYPGWSGKQIKREAQDNHCHETDRCEAYYIDDGHHAHEQRSPLTVNFNADCNERKYNEREDSMFCPKAQTLCVCSSPAEPEIAIFEHLNCIGHTSRVTLRCPSKFHEKSPLAGGLFAFYSATGRYQSSRFVNKPSRSTRKECGMIFCAGFLLAQKIAA